jgi:hypothetical protein
LPRGVSHSGPCDVTIGRYCYWRGDDEDDDPAPPEERSIRERRGQLINLLDSTSRQIPGDAWLAGQLIRYLVEAGDRDNALQAARTRCGASTSWCHALLGFAAHSFEQYELADSAYARALVAMTDAERCRWVDISDLLDGELGKLFDKLDCTKRGALARRATTLGAPLFLVSTTDLLTEYFARVTRAQMAERAATPDGESWGGDARELVTRYGWPTWYSRVEPSVGSLQRASITGHDNGRPYYFFPTLSAIEHPGETNPRVWRLDDPRAPMGYSPSFAKRIHDAPSQIARFRHGDTLVAIAAWDVSKDTSLARRDLDVALILTNDARPERQPPSRRRDEGGLIASIVADSGLISLELLDRQSKHAGRARVGFSSPGADRLRLSDLLVFRPWQSDTKRTLDSALAEHAMRTDAVRRGDSVAVFWEAYGLRREPVHFTLSVEQIGVSWMRKAAEAIRIADRTTGVRVQWQEVPTIVDGIAARDVRIDLSRLRQGHYRMQLTLQVPGEPTATSTRSIDVR